MYINIYRKMKNKGKNIITEFHEFDSEKIERERILNKIKRIGDKPFISHKKEIEEDLKQLASTIDWDSDGHFHQYYFEDGVKKYFDGWNASNLDNNIINTHPKFKRNQK